MIFSLWIINKAGGLVYQKDFPQLSADSGLAKLTSNDYLVLAGTFHGVHALTARISPVPSSSGVELLETDTFKLYCFQTLTGTKFLVSADPTHPNIEYAMRKIYDIYSDFVMKNPFYTPEMPIRSELFDSTLLKSIRTL
ncbi:Sybindin-like protein [Paraphysoderma sedebokerense]|nr:Sybindin-like protein [Paraphysoderma sedebokerense]